MKKIVLTLPAGGKVVKYKVAESTTGSVFRDYVKRDNNDFNNDDFFFIFVNDVNFGVLDESTSFSRLSSAKKIFLKIIFRFMDVSISYLDKSVKVHKFDMKETVGSNICRLNIPDDYKYFLSFRPKPPHFSCNRILCKSMMLSLQDWNGEHLIMHRAEKLDLANDDALKNIDVNELRNLYQSCYNSLSCGLSFLHPENWGCVICLQILIENKLMDINNKSLRRTVIPNCICENPAIINSVDSAYKVYKDISVEDAMERFVHYSIRYGINSLVEKVKFRDSVNKKKFDLKSKYLYMNQYFILVTKDLGLDKIKSKSFSSIKEMNCTQDVLHVLFDDSESWFIKSDRNMLIRSYYEDLLALNSSNQDESAITVPDVRTPMDNSEYLSASQSDADTSVSLSYRVDERKYESVSYLSEVVCPKMSETNSIYHPEEVKELKILSEINYKIDKVSRPIVGTEIPDLSIIEKAVGVFYISSEHGRALHIIVFIVLLLTLSVGAIFK